MSNLKTKQILCIACLIITIWSHAQNVGISATGATPHASSILDLNTGNTYTSPNGKGLLIPNIALTGILDAATVNSPATSLLVYNTASVNTGTLAVSPGYYYWDGVKWVRFSTGAISPTWWSLTGNGGTSAGSNFVGTTDAQDLVFKTNNTENLRILNTNGNVGIATMSPNSTLHVNGSVSASIVTVTSNYTILDSDYTIVCNTSATITLNLPGASTCKGRLYNIISLNGYDINFSPPLRGSSGNVTTISQQMSSGPMSLGDKVVIQSDGTNWIIVSW